MEGKDSARTVGMAMATANMDAQAKGTAREREAMARAACGSLALGVGLRSISSRIAREHERPASGGGHPRDSHYRQRAEQRRGTGGMEEDADAGHSWSFVKDGLRVPIQKTQMWQDGPDKKQVQGACKEDGEEVVNVRQMENIERTASAASGFEDGKAKNLVQFVNSVISEEDWASLGVGNIIVDSAADESWWPVGQGDAFPTKESRRKMLLRTADGGDM